jgi:hypothetical protein
MLQGLSMLFLSISGRFEVVLSHFKVISKLLRSFQGLFELFQAVLSHIEVVSWTIVAVLGSYMVVLGYCRSYGGRFCSI